MTAEVLTLSRLPVEQLPARLKALDLAGTEVHHLPDWKGYEDPKRLAIIRHIAMMRGRDPRIASLAVDIIKKAKAKPRQYKKQAAALLKWVQDPKNIYYVNEPGERLQDPIFTIKQGWGDCDDQVMVLCALFESIRGQGLPQGLQMGPHLLHGWHATVQADTLVLLRDHRPGRSARLGCHLRLQELPA